MSKRSKNIDVLRHYASPDCGVFLTGRGEPICQSPMSGDPGRFYEDEWEQEEE